MSLREENWYILNRVNGRLIILALTLRYKAAENWIQGHICILVLNLVK